MEKKSGRVLMMAWNESGIVEEDIGNGIISGAGPAKVLEKKRESSGARYKNGEGRLLRQFAMVTHALSRVNELALLS